MSIREDHMDEQNGGLTDPFSDPEAKITGPIEDVEPTSDLAEVEDEPVGFEIDNDESLASTQDALDEERDEIDAAASEFSGIEAYATAEDQYDAEAKALGFRLAWWRDTSLLEAHQAMARIFEQALGTADMVKALRESGLPSDVMEVPYALNMENGPLVMAGLQLLGIYMPELREEIKRALSSIPEPEPTDEEKEALEQAQNVLMGRQADAFREALEASGIKVVSEDEMQQLQEEQDAGLDTPTTDLGINLN